MIACYGWRQPVKQGLVLIGDGHADGGHIHVAIVRLLQDRGQRFLLLSLPFFQAHDLVQGRIVGLQFSDPLAKRASALVAVNPPLAVVPGADAINYRRHKLKHEVRRMNRRNARKLHAIIGTASQESKRPRAARGVNATTFIHLQPSSKSPSLALLKRHRFF